ncbi:MAG: methionine gamma-lyase family protein [Syntrophomonadaceae bacterium]|nr:methionine gamma-lyase family protein [Syntrophomonadaceae bacterium]
MSSLSIIKDAEKVLKEEFTGLEDIAYHNQVKVLNAFKKTHVRDYHFAASTGYGYGDIGRDLLEEVYADIFNIEDSLVRGQIISGTHAISACLLSLLQPGEKMLSAAGSPYDTLKKVIGVDSKSYGTLTWRGIEYSEASLDANGRPDYKAIEKALLSPTKLVLIQRSRGYSLRPALSLEDIEKLVKIIRINQPDAVIMVDNCYGEFVAREEPSKYDIDIMAGSLIKNPGGGLAPGGGYVCGKKNLVEYVSYQITAPGLGKDLGPSLTGKRYLFQGLFMAPHIVLQAMKSALLLAYVFEQFGYEVFPRWNEPRGDIVQAVKLKDQQQVLKFCQTVQSNSPVDNDVTLEFADLPGYEHKVVMAAGTFVQGSSIELSCDAPAREPYAVFMQGGLAYEHARFVISQLIETILL